MYFTLRIKYMQTNELFILRKLSVQFLFCDNQRFQNYVLSY